MTTASQRLLAGDKRALSRVISLLERHDPATSQVLKEIDPHTGGAYTVGITGPPGAGKSTIVDRLTELLRQQGLTVGILGVDPSSPFTGGALLGDRIRMQRHYLDSGVFIRSVATRGQSGGLPRVIKGMVRLLDAAGTDLILVETVGVGQSELGIMGVADTVVVTLMPESGDAIQTLKAGIMEIADLYVVNKADRDGSDLMVTAIKAMLSTAPAHPDWTPPVVLTQARSGDGISERWDKVEQHRQYITTSSELAARRSQRRKQEFLETVEEEVGRRLRAMMHRDPDFVTTLEQVANKNAEPYSSAMPLVESSYGSADWPGSLTGTVT